MKAPPHLAMNPPDTEVPNCTCFACLPLPKIILIVSAIEFVYGTIILPLFIILFWFGILSSPSFFTVGHETFTIYILLIIKCVVMVLGAAIGFFASRTKTTDVLIVYFLWIILRCLFQVILMSLKQYEAVIELFIWIWLTFEFSRYYKYIKLVSGDSYQQLQ